MNTEKQAEVQYLLVRFFENSIDEHEFILLSSYMQDEEVIDFYLRNVKVYMALKHLKHLSQQPGTAGNEIEQPGINVNDEQYNNLLLELARQEMTAPKVEILKEKPKKELIQKVVYEKVPRKFNKLSFYTAIISTAAMLLMIVYLNITPKTVKQPVARLIDSLNAKWGDPTFEINNGDEVHNSDDYRFLSSGVIKLEYVYGTEVIIEGPAYFKFPSEDEFELQSGRVFATVPENAAGFTVLSPTSTVIDLGTEFGVKVDVDGASDVCLFRGKASLIPGVKGKTSISRMLSVGQAKRVNNLFQVSDIEIAPALFVHEISSKTGSVWRGESLSIASLLSGGDGFTKGAFLAGIDPATGWINRQVVQDYERLGGKVYCRVPDREFVDGVFVPNGDYGANVVSSAGHTFDGFPLTDSYYWSDITANPYVLDKGEDSDNLVKIRLTEEQGMQKDTSDVFLHSNTGISFDLKKIRQSLPLLELTGFKSTCGIPFDLIEEEKKSSAELWVLVDGKKVFHHKFTTADRGNKDVNIPIKRQDQFLTLVATDGGDQIYYDWCIFANPVIELRKAGDHTVNSLDR